MISIIVPVYNIEKYIENCIQSVLAQSYPDFELLLVNDGSTDSGPDLCRKWEQKDSRIRLISKENGGVSSARNLGLDQSVGEYIFFLDGDDKLHPDCLKKLLEKMTPETDIVFCDYAEVDDEGFASDLVLQHKHYEGIVSHTEAMEDLFKAHIYPRVVWGKLYRKTLWDDHRFNHMAYSEDTFAMFELLKKNCTLYSIDEPLYDYLQRGTSASRQKKISEYENHTETLLYLYRHALSHHPEVRTYPAEEYIGVAYGLLKKYIQNGEKKKGLDLVENMKFVYKTSNLSSKEFSRTSLKLPTRLFYFLVSFRERIKPSA